MVCQTWSVHFWTCECSSQREPGVWFPSIDHLYFLVCDTKTEVVRFTLDLAEMISALFLDVIQPVTFTSLSRTSLLRSIHPFLPHSLPSLLSLVTTTLCPTMLSAHFGVCIENRSLPHFHWPTGGPIIQIMFSLISCLSVYQCHTLVLLYLSFSVPPIPISFIAAPCLPILLQHC